MGGTEHDPGDVLRRMDRARLQMLLVAYYRDLGWWVERATGDAGFDDAAWVLKRDRDILLLDCRHWGSAHRPLDAVSCLVRDLEGAGATGGILVDRRPFTHADHEAANRHGRVRLLDMRDLGGMLGDLPEQRGQADPFVDPLADPLTDPLLDPSVDRYAEELPVPEFARPRPRVMRPARRGNAMWWLIALGCLVVFVLLVRALLARTADTAVLPAPSSPPVSAGRAPVTDIAPVHVPAPRREKDAVTVDGDRRDEDAMRLIEESTPEM